MALLMKVLKWGGIILLVGFVVLVGFRMKYRLDLEKTNEQVAKIHATKLTLDDVLGKNLPPDPGEAADDTIAGVDANTNGIRDDVELAIFEKYPNSAKTRAPLLQYALVLQMQMTLPLVNEITVTATVEEGESRSNSCMWELSSRNNISKFLSDMEKYENFITKLQLNNSTRENHLYNIIEGNLRSYSASNEGCHIDLSTLPN